MEVLQAGWEEDWGGCGVWWLSDTGDPECVMQGLAGCCGFTAPSCKLSLGDAADLHGRKPPVLCSWNHVLQQDLAGGPSVVDVLPPSSCMKHKEAAVR